MKKFVKKIFRIKAQTAICKRSPLGVLTYTFGFGLHILHGFFLSHYMGCKRLTERGLWE